MSEQTGEGLPQPRQDAEEPQKDRLSGWKPLRYEFPVTNPEGPQRARLDQFLGPKTLNLMAAIRTTQLEPDPEGVRKTIVDVREELAGVQVEASIAQAEKWAAGAAGIEDWMRKIAMGQPEDLDAAVAGYAKGRHMNRNTSETLATMPLPGEAAEPSDKPNE